MLSGNQVITPDSGKVLSKVTISKPTTMISANIKKDVNIGGVVGTYESEVGSSSGGSETWVLNEELIVPEEVLFGDDIKEWTSQFVSKNNTFTSITIAVTDGDTYHLSIYYGSEYIGVINHTQDLDPEDPGYVTYIDKAYRKITFSIPPTGDLLTWLEANAVKQASDTAVQDGKEVTITENGTTAITPDVPYDAMKAVSVTTNVASSGGGGGDTVWYDPV